MKIKNYLNSSPLVAINYAYEKTIPKINKHLKKNNLNLLQSLVLISLFFDEQTDIKPSQLAEVFQTSRGNISHIISNLEYKGLVKRVLDSNDARSYKILIKQDGKKKAISLIKLFDQIQNHFEAELSASDCKKSVSTIKIIVDIFEKNKVIYS